ncbi:MAG: hypothetical protein RLZZ493_1599 [Bacteroidota bacterium]|jgi:hypothetical protein
MKDSNSLFQITLLKTIVVMYFLYILTNALGRSVSVFHDNSEFGIWTFISFIMISGFILLVDIAIILLITKTLQVNNKRATILVFQTLFCVIVYFGLNFMFENADKWNERVIDESQTLKTDTSDKLLYEIYINQKDSSVIAILNNDSINYKVFKQGTTFTLSQKDMIEIDRLLNVSINEHNKNQEIIFNEKKSKYPDFAFKKKNFIIDLKNYQRQYVAVKNVYGEKEVWVNCFCTTFDDSWKTDIYIVSDGGNCFFDLKINLDAKKYYDFMVNGDA